MRNLDEAERDIEIRITQLTVEATKMLEESTRQANKLAEHAGFFAQRCLELSTLLNILLDASGKAITAYEERLAMNVQTFGLVHSMDELRGAIDEIQKELRILSAKT